MDGMLATAQSTAVSVAVFLFAAIGLGLFALKVLVSAFGQRDNLFSLRLFLGGLAIFVGLALVYESYAILRGRTTISMATNSAFVDHPGVFVAVFSAIMALVGLLVVHFTRLAGRATMLAVIDDLAGGHALLAVAVLGVLLVAITEAVIRLTPLVDQPPTGKAEISWWVLFAGGVAYAIGALISWAINWRPR